MRTLSNFSLYSFSNFNSKSEIIRITQTIYVDYSYLFKVRTDAVRNRNIYIIYEYSLRPN